MNLTRVDTIVQFTQGSATVWNNANNPVPAGAVVIDTINKVIKEGDGATLFANLPICLDYDFNNGTSGAITPVGDDIGTFAIASNSSYSPSTVKLTDILTNITTLNDKSVAQNTRFTGINTNTIVLAVSQGTADGTIVVCSNGKYGPGTKTLAQLISDLIASGSAAGTSMHITDLVWYSDSNCTVPVSTPNDITENNTYWCVITGYHDGAELRTVDFSMSTQTAGITITNTNGLATYAILASTYGGTGLDTFLGAAIDSLGSIICVGYTKSEGDTTNGDAFIIKFDSNLNITAKKRLGGTAGVEQFCGVAVDVNNNIFCAGLTYSEGLGYGDTLIIKFDTNLNVLAKKRYGGGNDDGYSAVALDTAGNVYCIGSTNSEGTIGQSYNMLITKYDNNLNIVAARHYGGALTETGNGICVDSTGNIYCCGLTASDGAGNNDALIIKFDPSFNILARKTYGGVGNDFFGIVTIDKSGNIICVGNVDEGTGNDALVVKFDTSLNILAKKRYGGAGFDIFNSVAIDSDNNIICVGYTASEGLGLKDALLVKFDTSLNIIAKKRYGGAGDDAFNNVVIDSTNNIIPVGSTTSLGNNGSDALIMKFSGTIPAGSFTSSILTSMVLADSTLTLTTSNVTLGNSTGALNGTPNLIFADSTLAAATSNLTQKLDTIAVARYNAPTKLLTTIYSSNVTDQFLATTIDTAGNIICVGSSSVSGQVNGLIVKFSSTFVPIARKLFTGNYSEVFNSVVTDASNNIYCVGAYVVTSGGQNDAFIVKLDSTLGTVVAQKSFSGANDDVFYDVTFDTSSSNIFCVGYTSSEGSGVKDALIVKFDSNLTLLAKKRYGGINNDILYSVMVGVSGNIYCAGSTASEGANTSGLLLKLDANLGIVLRKIYNSTNGTATEFLALAVTAVSVIFCVGRVTIASGNKALVVKYDSSLAVLGSKLYGNTHGNSEYSSVAIDSLGSVVCSGKTNAEGAGNYDALIVKYSNILDIVGKKTYGSIGADSDVGCVIDGNNDIIISGYTVIAGSTDAIVTKLPSVITTGIYTNKFFTDLVLADSNLIASSDVSTVANSGLTLADSTLTLANSAMALNDTTGAIVTDTTIMDATPNIFKVVIDDVMTGSTSQVIPTFNISANDGVTTVAKAINTNINRAGIIEAIYGGSGVEQFSGLKVDKSGNIYCTGWTSSEGSGGSDALIVKFDSNFNILAKKRYGGTGTDDLFNHVAIDSAGNIFCSGYTNSEGAGSYDGLIVKLDSNLNILVKKRFGGTSTEYFYGMTIDLDNNIFCIGATSSEGQGSNDALIVKFDANLNIIAKKRYGGTSSEQYLRILSCPDGNIVAVGGTYSEGPNTPANSNILIMKFDVNLNIVARKVYGGANFEQCTSVAVDTNNNIYAVGNTTSEGVGSPTYSDAIIIKFDPMLNILAKKRYGGSNSDYFRGVEVDSLGNIICVGNTLSEIFGGTTYGDAILVKFDSNLNLLSAKRYGGTSDDYFIRMDIDSSNNMYVTGFTMSGGSGNQDALIVKFPTNLSTGSFTGSVLTGLTITDITTFTLNDITTFTLADSTLTLDDTTTLNLSDSSLIFADSALTFTKDTIAV